MRVLFVTIDPERDTPAFLADYLANFDPRVIGLTGTPEQIATAAKSFHVFYEKVPTSDGGYTMNHTALAFLMDRNGKFFGTLDYEENDEVKLQKLTRLLREG
jgi:protein SCO1/2